ncbi:hypothetical protein I5677_09045 [Mobilitalea sibirica]|uniref:Transglutaminase-like domain-containing protein n=1 Tax=Mobilitalea sibirica TaxID=1462919 RepID=A0A8J7HBF7_9FIRM|nr:transglutaminase domain-containing protein [Mobilitalea sibirica]MBH1941036.1 hypothetical protein [Mobilitalea sibirica]
MLNDKEKMYQVYHALLSMVLTWALTLTINQYYELRVHFLLCAIFSFVPAALVYVFDCNRKNTVSYLIIASVLPVLALFFWIRGINPIRWFQELIEWIIYFDGTEELYKGSYAHFVVYAVAFLSSILFYVIVRYEITKMILAAVVLAFMIYLAIQEIDISKVVVGIGIFYFLSIIVEICGRWYTRKAGKQEKRAGILYLAPVCLLLAVLSVSMPSKPEPLQWKGVKTFYHNIKDKMEFLVSEWGKKEGEFSIAFTGYSEEGGSLGTASLTRDNKIALKISRYSGYNPIYLIGSVSDTYTGNSWEKSRNDYLEGEAEYLLDYGEMVMALSRLDSEIIQDEQLVERRLLKVEYEYIKTKTFFYPLKTSWADLLEKQNDLSTEYANITFPKAVGKETAYQFILYDMNLKGEAFQTMLRELNSFSYNTEISMDRKTILWLEDYLFYYDSIDSISNRTNFYELLRDRANYINELYTTLPETLPERVKELAYEITEGYDTDYDKLIAIESYLKDYTYTLDPGRLPKDRDFVDYFLFDSKEGYCTSYATAMAILGRCIGIPTRYVEGFAADYNEEPADRHMYPVRNSQAHAWAEAYIEGFGWVPFESTPPFYDNRYITWKEKKKSQEAGLPLMEEFIPPQEIYLPPEEGFVVPLQQEKKASNFMVGLLITSTTVLILIILLVIYYITLKYKYNKIFKKADYNKKMYMLFLRILRLLKREGFVLGAQETILMLSKRIRDLYHYDRVEFSDVANIFMRYRYADARITEEEFNRVAIFYQGLENKQREEITKSRLLLEEFIFLMKKSNR